MKLLKHKNLLIVLFLQVILSSQAVLAQDYLFKIIAASGKCTVQKSGKSDWEKIKTGARLMNGDVIKLNDGDYAGLVSNNGKSLELKKAGSYNAESLVKMLASGKSNIQKFTEYVLTASVNKKSSDNMKTLGAVVRGKAEQIETLFPKMTHLMSYTIEAKWFPESSQSSYLFKIVNEQDRAVFMKETRDTSFKVDLSGFNLEKEGKYKWVVESLSKQASCSDSNYFSLYPDNRTNQIKDSLAELQKGLEESSALDRLVKIAFFQGNNLNYDIINEYEEILKLAPGVEEYADAYVAFLLENGMTKKAEVLLKKTK